MIDRYDILRSYDKLRTQVKDFLLSDKSREFFVFLFFFLIASAFWLLQTLNNDYETEFTVPVRLKDLPKDVVITSEPAAEMRIRVKDKGTVLLNYMLGKSFYPLYIDFKKYKGTESHVRIYAAEFAKMLTSQLRASTQLLAVNPDTLEYYYATGYSKKVPVRLRGHVGGGRQYYVADTLFRPDSVQVYAPRDVLDTITSAWTQVVSYKGITDTLTTWVPLEAEKGIKFNPARVQLTLPVDIFTEKTVEVPLVGINFPADKELRAFPSKVQVTFQVGLSRFRKITAEDFHIPVPYEELLKAGTEKYRVRLRHLPAGVSQVRIHPAQVDFLIEQIKPTDYGN